VAIRVSTQVIGLNQSLQVALNHYGIGQPAESSVRRIRWFFPMPYSASGSKFSDFADEFGDHY
jgi:hypothetical protein